jgi:hypothetical protein
MPRRFILIFCLSIFKTACCSGLYAQSDSLKVVFSKTIVEPGDTIDIDFTLLTADSKLNKATINCMITNDRGFERKLRWPLLNKTGVVQLIIDKKFEKGIYDFFFFVQVGIFQIRGNVLAPLKQKVLKAVLINNKGQINLEEVKVDSNNNFVFRNYIFEDYANLLFSEKNGKQNRLDIRIDAALDSAYKPFAVAGRRLKVGADGDGIFSPIKDMTRRDSMSYHSSEYLQEVIVYGTRRSTVDYYEENYVGGIFKDAESKSYSLIDDPLAQSSTDLLEYLQNKVPNIRITYSQNGDAVVKMRNVPVQFYLDEIPLDVSFIRSMSVADIAVVKLFQPPFIGNPGGNGGAVAVYTRRGGDVIEKSTGSYRFRVKGYTPALSILSTKD